MSEFVPSLKWALITISSGKKIRVFNHGARYFSLYAFGFWGNAQLRNEKIKQYVSLVIAFRK